MTTVHVILNAHIDPVWLWPWQSGLDTILNTCRSVCDLLDRNPDAIFTCGEGWKYLQIRQCDPHLFSRIKAHVAAKRWEPIGWWIQPDCNFPSEWAIEKNIRLGLDFFEKEFGSRPTIGYNVDSFGHAAALPGIMRSAGQDSYVMMRPKEHEMRLPARIFRWRGGESEPDITVFRIARSYCEAGERVERIRQSLMALPPGIEHTMVFMGVGDHGGGPSQRLVNWCRQNVDVLPGAKLVFSSPSRFFAAIASQRDQLPIVTGELQHHAVGCYSVHRVIKTAVRNAEHALLRAEPLANANELEKSWQDLCFNHFHDTLGGTCVPSGYTMPEAQLGGACAVADELLQTSLRRWITTLPDDNLQRIVAWNPSPTHYSNHIGFEPWIEGRTWNPKWRLLDEAGQPVSLQIVRSEAAVLGLARLFFRVDLPPDGKAIFRIDPAISPNAKAKSAINFRRNAIRNDVGSGLSRPASRNPQLILAGKLVDLPRLELLPDPTDTWSHDVDHYAERPAKRPRFTKSIILERGPILCSVLRKGTIGKSEVQEEWRIIAGEPFVELRLRVGWLETQKILKLVWPLPAQPISRIDGTMGGWLERELDGAERPLRDFTLLKSSSPARSRAVVCPNVFAMDATPARLRLTLLRSPLMAHHAPHPSSASPEARIADWGMHEFVFRFFADATPEMLDNQAMMLQRAPIIAECTKGMPQNAYYLD